MVAIGLLLAVHNTVRKSSTYTHLQGARNTDVLLRHPLDAHVGPNYE